MYLFLQASQGDQRSNIVQAPKITTFNGAPATIFNASQTYYVQSLTPIVGFGAVKPSSLQVRRAGNDGVPAPGSPGSISG